MAEVAAWLDSKLREACPPRPGVLGEAWLGHGGGFYIVEKHHISPGETRPKFIGSATSRALNPNS